MLDMSDNTSCSVSQEITPQGFLSDGETLPESVRSLLNDDMFKDIKQVHHDKISDNRDCKYQKCLSLFIRGDIKGCLESMVENGLLSEETLSDDVEVYDLYLTACNEILNFQDLGVTLKNIVRDTYSAKVESLKMVDHYASDMEKVMEFWDKYFNNCIKTIPIRRDPEFSMFLQTELKLTLSKSAGRIYMNGSNGVTIPTLLYFKKLVHLYIFKLEIENMGSKRNVKLYQKLCSSIPHLSEILTDNSMNGKGNSYESTILAQLEPPLEKKTPTPQIGNHQVKNFQNHVYSKETDANITKESLRSVDNDESEPFNVKTNILTYIKSNQYIQHIINNHRFNAIINHIANIKEHPQTIILASIALAVVLRYAHRRIRYVLRNFPALLNKLLPYLTEFLSLLTTT